MLLRMGLALAGLSIVAQPANAQVYCKSVGVPKGCVMRSDTPGAGAPGAGVAPGIGAGIGVGAAGVGVTPGPGTVGPDAGAPGVGLNRGGPANRPGMR